MEKIKEIIGYENYTISIDGEIRNKKNNKLIKTFTRGRNISYVAVALFKEGKQKKFYLHRLLAIHFIPNPSNHRDVHHINDNKKDNRIENLMWINQIEHCKISPKGYGLKNVNGKLTNEQVIEIRKMYKPYEVSCQDIANIFNVSRGSIQKIIYGKTFKYI